MFHLIDVRSRRVLINRGQVPLENREIPCVHGVLQRDLGQAEALAVRGLRQTARIRDRVVFRPRILFLPR